MWKRFELISKVLCNSRNGADVDHSAHNEKAGVRFLWLIFITILVFSGLYLIYLYLLCRCSSHAFMSPICSNQNRLQASLSNITLPLQNENQNLEALHPFTNWAPFTFQNQNLRDIIGCRGEHLSLTSLFWRGGCLVFLANGDAPGSGRRSAQVINLNDHDALTNSLGALWREEERRGCKKYDGHKSVIELQWPCVCLWARIQGLLLALSPLMLRE